MQVQDTAGDSPGSASSPDGGAPSDIQVLMRKALKRGYARCSRGWCQCAAGHASIAPGPPPTLPRATSMPCIPGEKRSSIPPTALGAEAGTGESAATPAGAEPTPAAAFSRCRSATALTAPFARTWTTASGRLLNSRAVARDYLENMIEEDMTSDPSIMHDIQRLEAEASD